MEKMDTGYGGASLAWLLCNKREMYYSLTHNTLTIITTTRPTTTSITRGLPKSNVEEAICCCEDMNTVVALAQAKKK